MATKTASIGFKISPKRKSAIKENSDRDFQTIGNYIIKSVNFYELYKEKVK